MGNGNVRGKVKKYLVEAGEHGEYEIEAGSALAARRAVTMRVYLASDKGIGLNELAGESVNWKAKAVKEGK